MNGVKQNLKSYFLLLIKPLIFSIVVELIWKTWFYEEYRAIPEDEEVISAVAQAFLIFSSFLITFIIVWIANQFAEMQGAIEEKKYNKFKKAFNKRIPTLIHFSILLLSCLTIWSIMVIPYRRYDVGLIAVMGISFIHCFFFFAARELDDPTKGCWQLSLPTEWAEKIEEEKERNKKQKIPTCDI